jgi:hypothetical protein
MVGLAAVVGVLYAANPSKADARSYLVTYGYYTPEKGEFEIEQYTDSFNKKDGGSDFRSRTELEYGVTDRLAASLYAVNGRPEGGSWGYEETKLELRYRITQPGKRFWDTAGYLEFVRPNESDEPYEMEAKGIFSHEFPKFNLTVNLIGEKELAPGEEIEKGYAIGLSPHSTGRTNYSLELYGDEDAHYIMPGFWVVPGKKQNIGIGVAVGLTGDSDRLQVRTHYAMEF